MPDPTPASTRWAWIKSDGAILLLGAIVLFGVLAYQLGAGRALLEAKLETAERDIERLDREVALLRDRLAGVDALTTTNYSDIGTLKTKQINDRAAIAALEKYHEAGN